MIIQQLNMYLIALFASAISFWLYPRLGRLTRIIYGLTALVTAISLVSYAQLSLINPSPFGGDETMTTNALWNISNGRWAWSDLFQQNLYSVHSFFILPVYLPFHGLIEHPHFFNVIHLMFAGSAAYVVFLLARKIGGSSEFGFAFALIYLLLPSTSAITLVECQPSIPAVPFLFLYFYFRRKRKRTLAFLSGCIASMGYEPFIVAIICEGVVEALTDRYSRKFGISLALAGIVVLGLFALNLLHDSQVSGGRHYATLGGSPLGALNLLFENPRALFGLTMEKSKVGFAFHLLFPLLALPLLASRYLVIGAGEFLLCILSDPGDDMHRIYSFYTHVVTVALVTSAIYGVKKIADRMRWPASRVALALFVHVLVCHFTYHHTMLVRLVDRLNHNYSWQNYALPMLASEAMVPEGSGIAVHRPTDAWRFPRRRIMLVDNYLTPKTAAMWDSGTLAADFTAVPDIDDYSELRVSLMTSGWEVVGRLDNLVLYRTELNQSASQVE